MNNQVILIKLYGGYEQCPTAETIAVAATPAAAAAWIAARRLSHPSEDSADTRLFYGLSEMYETESMMVTE